MQFYQQHLKTLHWDICVLKHKESTHQLNHLKFAMTIYSYMERI
mgnify:CR=1 FL=1